MAFKKLALTAFFAGISCMSLNAMAVPPSAEVILQGTLTNTTCTVTVNGGKSSLDVGFFKTQEVPVNGMVGEVPMPVTLTECKDGDKKGKLVIQGITSVGNNEQNIFVDKDSQTVGFKIADEDNENIITNGQGVDIDLEGKENYEYAFKVGMSTTKADPAAGVYRAPILVAYIVD